MDFLNKFIDQLRDLFASMTPGARVTTGALLAGVVVSLGFLFKQSTSGADAYLYGGEPLSRQEIIDIQGALSKEGLADFEVVGNMIRVPRGKKHLYMAAITNGGAAPRSAKSFLDDALNNYSPLSSSAVQKQQYKAAREKELSYTISQMSWVEEASVMYDVQETRGLRSLVLASAAVNVQPKSGEGVDTRRRKMLQEMVAAPFSGMRPEQVVITNLNGDDIAGSSEVRPEDFKTKYLEEKARFEQYVRSLVKSQLGHIAGVRVQIKAELDETLSSESIATKPEGQAVAVREIDSTDETEQIQSDGGARIGGFAQGPGRNLRAEEIADNKNTTKKKVTTSDITTQAFTSRVITTTSGLVPKRMGASIQVPRDYVIGIWKKRKVAAGNKEPDKVDDEEVKLVQGEIMDQIKTAVEPLMTELTAGKDDFSQVKVGFYDTLPAPVFEKPSAASKAFFWAEQHGNTLAMLGLAAFSLVMLRSMVRSGGGGDSPAGAPAIQVHDPNASGEEEEEDRPRLRFKKAESVKDDLAEMVREDPDAAAAILSNWISNAG